MSSGCQLWEWSSYDTETLHCITAGPATSSTSVADGLRYIAPGTCPTGSRMCALISLDSNKAPYVQRREDFEVESWTRLFHCTGYGYLIPDTTN